MEQQYDNTEALIKQWYNIDPLNINKFWYFKDLLFIIKKYKKGNYKFGKRL